MVGTIRVPSLDQYQHYKDRDPPWIKLHRSILTDYKFARLQDASKAHLIGIWLLASQMGNEIPADAAWIAARINATCHLDLQLFISLGFIELASGSLATCTIESIPMPIVETETETETEISKPTASHPKLAAASSGKSEQCPYEKIVNIYHEVLPDHPRVRELTNTRKTHIRARWCNGMERNLDTFRSYFEAVKRSRFLTGRVDPPPGRRVFIADFDFLMRQSTYVKILEGKYRD